MVLHQESMANKMPLCQRNPDASNYLRRSKPVWGSRLTNLI
jgi:hypothetical protein